MSNDEEPATYLLRLTPAQRAELEELARTMGKTRAWVVRRALARYAEELRTGRRQRDED